MSPSTLDICSRCSEKKNKLRKALLRLVCSLIQSTLTHCCKITFESPSIGPSRQPLCENLTSLAGLVYGPGLFLGSPCIPSRGANGSNALPVIFFPRFPNGNYCDILGQCIQQTCQLICEVFSNFRNRSILKRIVKNHQYFDRLYHSSPIFRIL